MKWYTDVAPLLKRDVAYDHRELVEKLETIKPGLTKSGYHWAISCLVSEGILERKGRGEYGLSDGNVKSDYSPRYSNIAAGLLDTISDQYPYVHFTIFETALMNDFLNHLIAQNTVFVQVEKESSVYIFRFLQEKGYQGLMYKPSRKDFNLYWSRDGVVVTDMISEAPVRVDKPAVITLEKMLVDICADKLISTTFSKSELPEVFEQASERYAIDQTKMLRYARRRNKEREITEYLGG